MDGIRISEMLAFLRDTSEPFSFSGNEEARIVGYSNLAELTPKSAVWIKNESYMNEELESRLRAEGSLLLVAPFAIEGVNCLVTEYPKGVYFSLLNEFFAPKRTPFISEQACVLTKDIGEDVSIGAHCFVDEDVSIGDRTVIHPGVNIICPCVIGSDCEIYPGAVIGADGFGYYVDRAGVPHREIHHRGVVIGDRVEIGANTCIDRGLLTDTVIGDDVKIDNLCHIAHNVNIAKNTLIVASSVICGSTKVNEGSYVAPNSSVLEQSTLGAGSKIGIGSVVLRDVGEGEEVFGNPARVMKR